MIFRFVTDANTRVRTSSSPAKRTCSITSPGASLSQIHDDAGSADRQRAVERPRVPPLQHACAQPTPRAASGLQRSAGARGADAGARPAGDCAHQLRRWARRSPTPRSLRSGPGSRRAGSSRRRPTSRAPGRCWRRPGGGMPMVTACSTRTALPLHIDDHVSVVQRPAAHHRLAGAADVAGRGSGGRAGPDRGQRDARSSDGRSIRRLDQRGGPGPHSDVRWCRAGRASRRTSRAATNFARLVRFDLRSTDGRRQLAPRTSRRRGERCCRGWRRSTRRSSSPRRATSWRCIVAMTT